MPRTRRRICDPTALHGSITRGGGGAGPPPVASSSHSSLPPSSLSSRADGVLADARVSNAGAVPRFVVAIEGQSPPRRLRPPGLLGLPPAHGLLLALVMLCFGHGRPCIRAHEHPTLLHMRCMLLLMPTTSKNFGLILGFVLYTRIRYTSLAQ